MKKNKLFASFILISLFTGMGCSNWFEDNSDTIKINSGKVFSESSLAIGSVVNADYNLLGGFWAQYWTQSNGSNMFKYIDQYNVTSSDFNPAWSKMYLSLTNLQEVINSSVDSKNWSMNLMATSMQCYALQILADLYNQVPLNASYRDKINPTPEFVNGEVIYDTLIARLNRALEKKTIPLNADEIKNDRIFNGDMGKWRQFANTLKLKIYMRQMYARPQVAQAGIAAMYTAGESFIAEDAQLDIFSTEPDLWNPFYNNCIARYSTTNLKASATLFLFLKNKSDNRFSSLFKKLTDGTDGQPLPQGGYSIDYNLVKSYNVADPRVDPGAPIYFISKAESYFLQAEAIAIGWGQGDDKAMYDNGVKAAFEQFELDGSSYIAPAAIYEYPSGGDFEAKQKAIIMQKWLSMAGVNGIEAFLETNRTHYPAISTIPAFSSSSTNQLNPAYQGGEFTYSLDGITSGLFPKRLVFPKSERDLNPNTPTEVALTEKVWWDRK